MAPALQHGPAAQQSGLPTPSTRGDSPLVARLRGYAPPPASQGRGGAFANIDSGTTRGGRSDRPIKVARLNPDSLISALRGPHHNSIVIIRCFGDTTRMRGFGYAYAELPIGPDS